MPEKKYVMIWSGIKEELKEGQNVEDLLEAYDDGAINYMGMPTRKITDLEGNTLIEKKGDFKF